MIRIKIKITFTEECLGMSSNNPEIYDAFIASKAPDAASREEEIAAIGVDEYIERGKTVFPKDENGNPFFWDYQIKGFFKGACQMLRRCKGEKFSKACCGLKAYKQVIDGCIFPQPRKIPIHLNGPISERQRRLRAQTMQGERNTLASSESVAAGSWIEFDIVVLSHDFEPLVTECLDYGELWGIGQWRNSGAGRFKYELIGRSDE